jgi:Mce-associated membrane protein
MATSRKAGAVPWLVAGAAGVVLAALLLVYFAFLLPDKRDIGNYGGLSKTEQTAVTAAEQRAVNLVSFRRAHFDADWARALAGTTGTLHSEVGSATQKKNTKAQLDASKADVGATVTHASLEGATGKAGNKSYVVLVSLNGYHTNAKTQTIPSNLEVTMVRQHGSWLASDVQSVGVSG